MVDHTELIQNEVFLAFASYATIVLSKMMFLSLVTGFYRMTRKVSHLEAIFLLRVKFWNIIFLIYSFFFIKPDGTLFSAANEVCSDLVQRNLMYFWNKCFHQKLVNFFF